MTILSNGWTVLRNADDLDDWFREHNFQVNQRETTALPGSYPCLGCWEYDDECQMRYPEYLTLTDVRMMFVALDAAQ